MLKNKKILFTILMVLLLFLIPNVVKADEEYITQIDATIPAPVIGEKPATVDEITLLANDGTALHIDVVHWERIFNRRRSCRGCG